MANKRIIIEPNKFYHIYNHAVGNEELFKIEDNYKYFLKKYAEYINPIAKTYAYCLMPNHFHFLISIRNDKDLLEFYENRYVKFKVKTEDPAGFRNPQGLSMQTSKHFGNFFNAYAKAFNKKQNRRGSLFEDDFKRIEVKEDKYLRNLVWYIHYNPVHHNFTNNIKEWKYSSFQAFLSKGNSYIEKQEVLNWFHDLENFIYFHKKGLDGFEVDFE